MRNKSLFGVIILLVILQALFLHDVSVKADDVKIPVFRLYDISTGEHFYTRDISEKEEYLKNSNWEDENIGFYGVEGGVAVYRVLNPSNNDHHYTTKKKEALSLRDAHNWIYEGIGWYAPTEGKPVYRLYNPNCKGAGSHHYTSKISEKKNLLSLGWEDEGVAWYDYNSKSTTANNNNLNDNSSNNGVVSSTTNVNGAFIVNTNNNKIHMNGGCSKQPNKNNRVYFNSLEEAKAYTGGSDLCKLCWR